MSGSETDDTARGRRRDDVSLKEYVDGQVQPWTARMVEGDVTLREYVEAMFERDRTAVEVASVEREKAAQALRIELDRAIQEGNRALREHIALQVTQIQAALVAANTIELARIAGVNEAAIARDVALRSEVHLINESSETAIAKAEAATDKRFESVNEFRAQLSTQTASFLPREVADSQFAELRRAMSELAEKVGRLA